MSYSELIKNFGSIRDTMREFFVYGFKSRDEYTKKSPRSYDNERRRLESWLGGYMRFRRNPEGKAVFLSIDSRAVRHNPLFRAWKVKSFTDGDITLHFLLMDILCAPGIALTLAEIMEQIDERLSAFPEPKVFDESTVRKKLKEYAALGIVGTEKKGKAVLWHRCASSPLPDLAFLGFFSETAPCGVIGSFLYDRVLDDRAADSPDRAHGTTEDEENAEDCFRYKHHYITGAADSEILYTLFDAIREKRNVTVETGSRQKDRVRENHVVPLCIMMSVQSGRQYVMAYVPRFSMVTSFRLDAILSVRADDVCPRYDSYKDIYERMRPHIWGVSTQNPAGQTLEYVEFTIRWGKDEAFIPARLEREKRCGTVEHLGDGRSRFSAWVYDSRALIPWIRTFICRITDYHFSNGEWQKRFADDLETMYGMYGLSEGTPAGGEES